VRPRSVSLRVGQRSFRPPTARASAWRARSASGLATLEFQARQGVPAT
jgi:hypothetical protein